MAPKIAQFIVAVLCLLSCLDAVSQPGIMGQARQNTWMPNGVVSAIAHDDDFIYVGGNFNTTGEYAGGFHSKFHDFDTNGGIYCLTTTDGNVGYYGGKFSAVEGLPRFNAFKCVTHPLIDLDWNPVPNAAVLQMFATAEAVYMCGEFTEVRGEPRGHIAAVDTVTGTPREWAPDANGPVRLMVPGSPVYIGGDFTSIGGQARNRIACLDPDTGELLPEAPEVDGTMHCMVYDGAGGLFIGGEFSAVNGQPRQNIARLNAETATLTNWRSDTNGAVSSISLNGDRIIIAGAFTELMGLSRLRMADISLVTRQVGALSLPLTQSINLVAALGNNGFYAYEHAYPFGTLHFRGRYFETPSEPDLSIVGGPIRLLNNTHLGLTFGGDITCSAGFITTGIFQHSRTTGEARPWGRPRLIGNLYDIAVSDTLVFLGGSFTTDVQDTPQSNIVVQELVTDSRLPLLDGADGAVVTMEVADDKLYLGGLFTTIDGVARERLARFDLTTNQIDDWNPGADGLVSDICVVDETIHIAGYFQRLGGAAKSFLGAVDTDGNLLPWSPQVNAPVQCLGNKDGLLYVGGEFTRADNAPRNYLAAYSLTSGALANWDPNADAPVAAIKIIGEIAYVGGWFNRVGGIPARRLAAVNSHTAAPFRWMPQPDNRVMALDADDDQLFVGGAFRSIGGTAPGGIAIFEEDVEGPRVERVNGLTGEKPGPRLDLEIVFSENVSNVDYEISMLQGANDPQFTSLKVEGGPRVYQVKIEGLAGRGNLRLEITPGDIHDAAGNFLATTYTSPHISINTLRNYVQATPKQFVYSNKPIPCRVDFSAPPVSFGSSNIWRGQSTISNFSGSGSTYEFTITPAHQGSFSVTLVGMRDADGYEYHGSKTIQGNYDTVPPGINWIEARPSTASLGDLVEFYVVPGESIGELFLTVNGNPASRRTYDTYAYRVTSADPVGQAEIVVMAKDRAGNVGVTSRDGVLEVTAPPDLPVVSWPLLVVIAGAGAALLRRRY